MIGKMCMTNTASQKIKLDPLGQHTEEEKTAYSTGYSDGFAVGFISELEAPTALIPQSLDHPAYVSGYADGKADGAQCRT
jgi:hypothetical protein